MSLFELLGQYIVITVQLIEKMENKKPWEGQNVRTALMENLCPQRKGLLLIITKPWFMLRDKIFLFFMLLDHHLSKQRPKGHVDSRIYACFVHQTKDFQTPGEKCQGSWEAV